MRILGIGAGSAMVGGRAPYIQQNKRNSGSTCERHEPSIASPAPDILPQRDTRDVGSTR